MIFSFFVFALSNGALASDLEIWIHSPDVISDLEKEKIMEGKGDKIKNIKDILFFSTGDFKSMYDWLGGTKPGDCLDYPDPFFEDLRGLKVFPLVGFDENHTSYPLFNPSSSAIYHIWEDAFNDGKKRSPLRFLRSCLC